MEKAWVMPFSDTVTVVESFVSEERRWQVIDALNRLKIRVLVTTLNNPKFLRKTLNSIKKESGSVKYDLSIVADIPTPETLQVLDEFGVAPENRVINDQKVGWVKAVNQGIQHEKADIYVYTADDTVVTTNWLEKLCTPLLLTDYIGFISPLTNASGQGIQQLINCPNDRYQTIQRMGQWVSTYHRPLVLCYDPMFGMSFAIPQRTFDKIGYFDEQFYIAHAEIDFQMRVKQVNMSVGLRMDCFVYHYGKVTANVNPILREKWNRDTDHFNQKWGGQIMRYK